MDAPCGSRRDTAEGLAPAMAEESLPQRRLLVSLESLVLWASFAFNSKHDLLRKVGWEPCRSRPDRQVLPQRIWELRTRFVLPTHVSERYAERLTKSSAATLIDSDEDRTLRAVLIGMLRERPGRLER